jgi:hypothetical protein
MKLLRTLSLGGAAVVVALLTSSTAALPATADDSQSNSDGTNQVNIIGNSNTVNQQSGAQWGEENEATVPPGTFLHLVKAGTTNCLQATGRRGQPPIVAPCVTSGGNVDSQRWLRFNSNHVTQFQNQAFRDLCLEAFQAPDVEAVLQIGCNTNPDTNPATSRDNQIWIPIRDGSRNPFDAGFVNARFRDRCLGQSGSTATLVPCTNVGAPLWHWGFPNPALTETFPDAAAS